MHISAYVLISETGSHYRVMLGPEFCAGILCSWWYEPSEVPLHFAPFRKHYVLNKILHSMWHFDFWQKNCNWKVSIFSPLAHHATLLRNLMNLGIKVNSGQKVRNKSWR